MLHKRKDTRTIWKHQKDTQKRGLSTETSYTPSKKSTQKIIDIHALSKKTDTQTPWKPKTRYLRREGRAQRPHTLLHTKIGGKKITFALMKNKTKTKIDTQERGPSIDTSYTPLKKNRHSKTYRHSHCWKKTISDVQTHRHTDTYHAVVDARCRVHSHLCVCVCMCVCLCLFVCVCVCVSVYV